MPYILSNHNAWTLCVKPQIHLTASLTFIISSAFQAPRTGNREEAEYLT